MYILVIFCKVYTWLATAVCLIRERKTGKYFLFEGPKSLWSNLRPDYPPRRPLALFCANLDRPLIPPVSSGRGNISVSGGSAPAQENLERTVFFTFFFNCRNLLSG